MVFIPQEFLQRQMERRIRLKTLNNHIICKICKGYLIDATTVTECLHTFCKSCLVKHLEDNNTCPTCEIVIHQSYPLQYISYDRTMQDIVYKLVPNLQYNEIKRERDFYRRKGLPCPKVHTPGMLSEKDAGSKASSSKEDEADCHRSDEQVNILLESSDSVQLKQMRRKFIRCSAQATITHLKKFIAKKLFNNLEKYKEVSRPTLEFSPGRTVYSWKQLEDNASARCRLRSSVIKKSLGRTTHSSLSTSRGGGLRIPP
ncbi:polycomb group RING finger protein 3 isoform X3 [Ixodes scapularis]|uniref:polycomb group RING finger protein 3 isoform X3 n=1 Tax=Ixodes scapularis TaxID=6945 RepID=UPI001C384562|nr:polycomb group RING finger protein 3 isoform X3 [Ixodes scapularis]